MARDFLDRLASLLGDDDLGDDNVVVFLLRFLLLLVVRTVDDGEGVRVGRGAGDGGFLECFLILCGRCGCWLM